MSSICNSVERTNLGWLFINMLLIALLVHGHLLSLLTLHLLCLLHPNLLLHSLLLQLTHNRWILPFHLFRGQCSLQTCYLEGREREVVAVL